MATLLLCVGPESSAEATPRKALVQARSMEKNSCRNAGGQASTPVVAHDKKCRTCAGQLPACLWASSVSTLARVERCLEVRGDSKSGAKDLVFDKSCLSFWVGWHSGRGEVVARAPVSFTNLSLWISTMTTSWSQRPHYNNRIQ